MKMTEELRAALKVTEDHCPSEYAKTYVRAIPESIRLYGEDGLRVQMLYVIGNLSTWRGELARNTKKVFKRLIG